MKKFFIIFFVLIFCSGFAYAEDILDLSGTMRVRAINKTDFDFDGDADDDAQYWDQRLRIGGAITPADGISAHFRFDLSEGVWGGGDWKLKRDGWSRGLADEDESIHVDRAYLQIKKDLFTFKAGQFFAGWGNYTIMDHQTTGLYADINVNPVVISLHYAKLDENPLTKAEAGTSTGAFEDNDPASDGVVDDIDGQEDEDLYAAKVSFAGQAFSAGIQYAMINDDTDADDSPAGVGLFGTANFGMVALNASLDYFTGSKSDDVDYVGTQFYLNAGFNVMDPLTISAMVLYAMGTDEADEAQRTAITAGGESFIPLGFQGALAYAFYPVGSLYGGESGVFDPTGADAGVQGFGIGVDYAIIEGLDLHARIGYLAPVEDDNTDINSFTTGALDVDYKVLDNTTLSAGYALSSRDVDEDLPDDTKSMGMLQLKVSF